MIYFILYVRCQCLALHGPSPPSLAPSGETTPVDPQGPATVRTDWRYAMDNPGLVQRPWACWERNRTPRKYTVRGFVGCAASIRWRCQSDGFEFIENLGSLHPELVKRLRNVSSKPGEAERKTYMNPRFLGIPILLAMNLKRMLLHLSLVSGSRLS